MNTRAPWLAWLRALGVFLLALLFGNAISAEFSLGTLDRFAVNLLIGWVSAWYAHRRWKDWTGRANDE